MIYGVGGLIAPFLRIWAIDWILDRCTWRFVVVVSGFSGLWRRHVEGTETGLVDDAGDRLTVSSIRPSLVRKSGFRVGERQFDRGQWSGCGSRLIGRATKPEYFQPRPSSAGNGYDPTASAGRIGPTSAKLINGTTKKDRRTTKSRIFSALIGSCTCVDNGIAYDSSTPLSAFMDAQGNLDDVKLINAFNDRRHPPGFMPTRFLQMRDYGSASVSTCTSSRERQIQTASGQGSRSPAEQVERLHLSTPRCLGCSGSLTSTSWSWNLELINFPTSDVT